VTTTLQDPARVAKIALACLDLTSLNDGDTPEDIARLCARAIGAHGRVAAVCVWPRFAAQARALLPREVAVAAVANFPDGGSDLARAVRDTEAIVQAGAQEVDLVLPYRELAAAPALLAAVRRACGGLKLKVIVETGALADAAPIRRACGMALDAGADFLKTSTGKTPVSATLPAARLLLEAIVRDRGARARVGLKPAGGIRTVADAAAYIALAREAFGSVGPERFRIGASGLLNDIEAVLGGGNAAAAPTSY
jgi:deoxyribose-phosphate aldolase